MISTRESHKKKLLNWIYFYVFCVLSIWYFVILLYFRLNSTFKVILVFSLAQERCILLFAFYLSPTCFLPVTSPYVLDAFNSTGIRSMFTMFFCDSGGGVLHGKIMLSIDEHIKPERKRGVWEQRTLQKFY